MDRCYNCGEEIIPKKISEEHIIPNSCGGKLKSTHILCSDCNGKFGETFDVELANQINSIANLLLIKRERGEPRAIKGKTLSGDSYNLDSKGNPILTKPTIEINSIEGGASVSIVARNEKEFEQILTGLKRKYPQLDKEEINNKAKRTNKLLDEPIQDQITIGGINVFKAIAKIALNYYMSKGGDRKYILSVLPFINSNAENNSVWMYYPDIELHVPDEGAVNHILHLEGLPTQKILFCYVELFNIYSYIVLLDSNYDGPEINAFYCYNVLNQNVISNSKPSFLSREKVLNTIKEKSLFGIENVERKFNYVLSIVRARQNQNLATNLSEKIIKKVLEKHPEGTEITEDMLTILADEFVKEMKPYIERSILSSLPDE